MSTRAAEFADNLIEVGHLTLRIFVITIAGFANCQLSLMMQFGFTELFTSHDSSKF
jgi:hypothetical protein